MLETIPQNIFELWPDFPAQKRSPLDNSEAIIVNALPEAIKAETMRINNSDIPGLFRIAFANDETAFNSCFKLYPHNPAAFLHTLEQDTPSNISSRFKGMQQEALNTFSLLFWRFVQGAHDMSEEQFLSMYRTNFYKNESKEGDEVVPNPEISGIYRIFTEMMFPKKDTNYSKHRQIANPLHPYNVMAMWNIWRSSYEFTQEEGTAFSAEDIAGLWFDERIADSVRTSYENWVLATVRDIGSVPSFLKTEDILRMYQTRAFELLFGKVDFDTSLLPEANTDYKLIMQPQSTIRFPAGLYLKKFYTERQAENPDADFVDVNPEQRLQFKAKPDMMLIKGNQIVIVDYKSSLGPRSINEQDFYCLPLPRQWQIYITHLNAIALALKMQKNGSPFNGHVQLPLDFKDLASFEVRTYHVQTDTVKGEVDPALQELFYKVENLPKRYHFNRRNYSVPPAEFYRLNRELAVFADILLGHKSQLTGLLNSSRCNGYTNPTFSAAKMEEAVKTFESRIQ